MHGNIKFLGNPWPKGHPLKEFYLGILLHEAKGDLPAKASLDLRFRSENYYYPFDYEAMLEASRVQSALSSKWEKIETWLNYGFASANSIASHDSMMLADENNGFELDYLDDFNRKIDPIPEIISDKDSHYQIPAFQSHILARDDTADHQIRISRDPKSNLYNIIWKGKCNKAKEGNYRYRHEFELHAFDVPFAGYSVRKLDWTEKAKLRPEERDLRLRNLANRVLINPGKMLFNIGRVSGRDRLLPNQ